MKNSIIIFSLLLGSSLFADELSWVNDQVEAIKPARSGMNTRSLSKLKDPFIFLKKNDIVIQKASVKSTVLASKSKTTSTKKRPLKVKHVYKVLELGAILNNSVMISGEWYKLGEKVSGYKIKEIHGNSVLLVSSEKKILLSTKSRSKKIKFLK